MSVPDKWMSAEVGRYGASFYYGGVPLIVELAEYVKQNVGGITGYNAAYTSYAVPVNKNGDILGLIESNDEKSSMDSLLTGLGI